MGSKLGVEKIAAKRIGMSLDEYRVLREAGYKWCTKGKHWQSVEYFSKDSTRGDGLKSTCKDCDCTSQAGPTRKLRTEMRAKGLEWCRDCLEWLPNHRVHAGLCRQCANRRDKERYASNQKYRQERRQHAYSRKRNIEPIPVLVQELLISKFQGLCAYCGNLANTWDHIVPVVQGGDSQMNNIVPACVTCNSSKKTKDVFSWMKEKGFEPSATFLAHICRAPRG